ncbi:1,25-dihydroxyvitamin D(3) 24-hydroxylase, mitochondrial-like [Haliotis asinina]|uniref:1,25-dihydroxyvitamin D(3) 24-hydroxylase, mitochondrial-like n=1 Tax=Haliotis asinina TaxID=109174 RepID=UPI003531D19C
MALKFATVVLTARQARLALVFCRGKATTVTSQSDMNEEAKPMSQIPGPKGLARISSTFQSARNAAASHKWIQRRHEEFGPIFRESTGVIDLVFLSDADAVEQLLRQDGKYPERVQIDHWLDYRKRHGIPTGLVMADGPHWHRLRRVIDKPMLKIRAVNSYAVEFNDVVAEFIARMHRVRRSDNSIPDLAEELFGWSVESIGRLLFEKKLGCLSDQRDQETQAFIDSVHAVFESTREMIFLPSWAARIVMRNVWKRHEEAWGTIFRVANDIIGAKLRQIQEKGDDGSEVGFLASFVQENTLSIEDIYSNVSELLGAAIDTTSNTTQMTLHEIAKNPQVQGRILEEVNRVVPPDQQPTAEHLKDMHYLKAVIKETLRMYPTAPVVLRILQQEATILGYTIPKGVSLAVHLYPLGRNPKYYDDPDEFRPERWLRDEGNKKIHAFAWLPFGFGPRMCVGRRVAELEMQLLISQLVRKFHIEPVSHKPMRMKTNLLLMPVDPVEIRLVDRVKT